MRRLAVATAWSDIGVRPSSSPCFYDPRLVATRQVRPASPAGHGARQQVPGTRQQVPGKVYNLGSAWSVLRPGSGLQRSSRVEMEHLALKEGGAVKARFGLGRLP